MRAALGLVAALLATLALFAAVVAHEAFWRGYRAGAASCAPAPSAPEATQEEDESLAILQWLLERELVHRQLTFDEDDFKPRSEP